MKPDRAAFERMYATFSREKRLDDAVARLSDAQLQHLMRRWIKRLITDALPMVVEDAGFEGTGRELRLLDLGRPDVDDRLHALSQIVKNSPAAPAHAVDVAAASIESARNIYKIFVGELGRGSLATRTSTIGRAIVMAAFRSDRLRGVTAETEPSEVRSGRTFDEIVDEAERAIAQR